MQKQSRQNILQAIASLACAGVLWMHLGEFGASEFSGGSLTGKISTMADIGALLFLCTLALTILVPRIGATVVLLAIALCLPLYLFVLMPGPYRQIFKGEYSVPLQRAGFPRFSAENITANTTIVDLLKEIAEKKNATPAQISLAWLLAAKAVDRLDSRYTQCRSPEREPGSNQCSAHASRPS